MSHTPSLLPCPFCGGDARHDAHADDCYFILHRKFKNSGADMSPAFEVLAAWNRRTPHPTQAQAGAVPLTREQVKAICVEAGYETATLQERADFINGIRHAERHHGITQKGV